MSSNHIWKLRPDPTKNNWLEKLYEWRDRFGDLSSGKSPCPRTRITIFHTAVPIIRGIRMADCTGSGSSKKAAMNEASQKLSDQDKLTR
ncbi:hypothetical protein RhiXN_05707 [Rhizoctonia solani]|uniref:DRBM domain-containing protein n=1 Tax=Rhizoctonia solani TaxID=456999 RepID=A0A8H8NXJ5_9AGAM|nr:uncharacterized protein RhiXN_05707 [Rhizoctonia solani]QRW20718.1 hypothetical protein RhiXN_05707 [Rhizoctonia solani]